MIDVIVKNKNNKYMWFQGMYMWDAPHVYLEIENTTTQPLIRGWDVKLDTNP